MTATSPPDPVAVELVRTQFRQMRRSSLAGLSVVLLVGAVAWLHGLGLRVAVWAALYALWYAAEEAMIRRYERVGPPDAQVERWGLAASAMLALSGLIWGAGFFAFIDPDKPLSVALLICAMAGLTAGSIGYRSTILLGFNLHNLLVAAPLALRLAMEPRLDFLLLAVSCLVYLFVILGYGRSQNALIRESLRIRFSNAALVEALRAQTVVAEAARAEAETASLAKSQFLAAASHDLRQPLHALSLFAGTLGELRLEPPARAIVHDMQESVSAMEGLFSGLLDVSRLDAGVVTPHIRPVSMDALFDRLSQCFRPIALNRGLDLRFRSDGEWVISDAVLLEQILANLVSNALQWTRRGGVLAAVRRAGGAARLEVWDTGVGVAPEHRARIFDDFVQVGNVARDRSRGLGLGLSIARRAAALLGTHIELVSRVDVGSRFRVVQPLAMAGASHATPTLRSRAIPPIPRDRALPVLVVDDDPTILAALGDLLARWGVEAELQPNAEGALAAACDPDRHFGLILCDYRLGGSADGLELVSRIRVHRPSSPPVVVITGDLSPSLEREAAAAHVVLLHKPVRPPELSSLLGVDWRAERQRS